MFYFKISLTHKSNLSCKHKILDIIKISTSFFALNMLNGHQIVCYYREQPNKRYWCFKLIFCKNNFRNKRFLNTACILTRMLIVQDINISRHFKMKLLFMTLHLIYVVFQNTVKIFHVNEYYL